MIVLDQYPRRIIGFEVHSGYPTGINICPIFIEIKYGNTLPKHISTDNDPLVECHHWQANLRILDNEEIKSVSGCPISHPFIERVLERAIGACHRELFDHKLFWNEGDLQRKLVSFQDYYNEYSAHMFLDNTTPDQKVSERKPINNVINLKHYRWKSYGGGLFKLPTAA